MKKVFSLIILSAMVMLLAGFASAGNGNPGSIWTTRNDCGTLQQDANAYAVGEKIFINGAGFSPSTSYAWTIIGKPGGASCDPGLTVASGTHTTDANGAFCFEAYIVQPDDVNCGGNVYGVNFNGKNDNYHVNENLPVVPEFGLIAGMAAVLGALGVFFVVRRK